MTPFDPTITEAEQDQFRELAAHLPKIWESIQSDPSWEHTSVIVPSLSVNQEELAKVQGASFYEERLLFSLIRLRNPRARVIYVTSQPIHSDIIDYYLQLLVGVPASHARQRLLLVCMFDASPKPLTQKILERPRVLERLQRWIGDTTRSYLTVYNSTVLERKLAVALGVPLNALDPELLWLGTKSGCKRVFREAGIPCAPGFENLRTEFGVGPRNEMNHDVRDDDARDHVPRAQTGPAIHRSSATVVRLLVRVLAILPAHIGQPILRSTGSIRNTRCPPVALRIFYCKVRPQHCDGFAVEQLSFDQILSNLVSRHDLDINLFAVIEILSNMRQPTGDIRIHPLGADAR